MTSTITRILLFAPQNCTGNSGAVGDTILQTSFVRTLLRRDLFPRLRELHWWGTRWVITDLFPDLNTSLVRVYEWDGSVKSLDENPQYRSLRQSIRAADNSSTVAFVCTRNEGIARKVKADLRTIRCLEPTESLDAQSPVHLSRQLHSCLEGLSLYVPDLPQPRIPVTDGEINEARKAMRLPILRKTCEVSSQVKHSYDLEVDRVFLLQPGLQKGLVDKRTWTVEKWKELAQILGEVGVVIVACDARDTAEAERAAAKEIVTGDQTYNWRFARRLKLKELAAWACASTVCIARDSGPMHVASAAVGPRARAPVVGLFSVMCPDTWRPLSDSFKGLGRWPLPLDPYITPADAAVEATHWDNNSASVGRKKSQSSRAVPSNRAMQPTRSAAKARRVPSARKKHQPRRGA